MIQGARNSHKGRTDPPGSGHYALVNVAIWGIWAVIAAGSQSSWPWPVFLTLFWGIGLAMNAWDVYLRKPITENELRHEMEHLRGDE
jgi:polyferredoxin